MSNPTVAACAGLVLSLALILSGRVSTRSMTPEEAYVGLAKVAVSLVVRMFLVVFALLAFHLWARQGLLPFGIALVAGFMLMMTVELMVVSRKSPGAVSDRTS
jgi:hypothetical protein